MSLPTLTALQNKFPNIYASLSDNDRNVLQCLSVIYHVVSRTNLMNCLDQAGLRNEHGQRFVVKELKSILESLQQRKLVKLSSRGAICNPEIVELVAREAVTGKSFEKIAKCVQKIIPFETSWSGAVWYTSYEQGLRELRIAIYQQQSEKEIAGILALLEEQYPREYHGDHPFELIFFNPYHREGLFSLSKRQVYNFVIPLLSRGCLLLESVDVLFSFLQEYAQENGLNDDEYNAIVALYLISRGEVEQVESHLQSWKVSANKLSYRGWFSLLQGKSDEAQHYYEQGLQALKKDTGKRKVVYSNLAGFFYPVALLQSGESEKFQKAMRYLDQLKKKKSFTSSFLCTDLEQTILFAQGQRNKAEQVYHSLEIGGYSDYASLLMAYLTLCWQGSELKKNMVQGLELVLQQAEKNGYYWYAKEAAAIMVVHNLGKATSKKKYRRLVKQCPLPDLCEAIRPREQWEQVLEALATLNSDPKSAAGLATERLVWWIDFDEEYEECDIVPRIQKLSKNGKWTKGRAVALSRLSSDVNTLSFLTSQDRNAIGAIETTRISSWGGYGGNPTYVLRTGPALAALVGHPLLFWADNPSVPVELTMGTPELHVVKEEKGYEIKLFPFIEHGKSYCLTQETPTRLKYIPLTQEYERLFDIIGESVTVPFQAKERVVAALSEIAKVLTIQSDIGGTAVDAQMVEADARPHVHMIPYNNGLQVEALCRPFSTGGGYYRPGTGGETVVADINGEQLQTKRDLELEKHNAALIPKNCPALSYIQSLDYEWIIDDPETCLELLCELRELGDQVVLEWPKGESLKVTPTISFDNLSLKIQRDNDWFGATGSLRVDDDLILDMKKLLALSVDSESRFVPLDDGRFLALSKSLKQRIEELRAYSENHGKGVRFSPLAGLALQEFTEEAGNCKSDGHWKKNLKRFQTVTEPEVPSTLRATLREYQEQGFRWLGCLSALGAGACLADDMGLGKTVQALAAVLLRAAKGPTLVVAPTSVMMNWQDEATRFAPTLNVHFFGNGNRQELLDGLAEFDLVICSYGLLQSEGKMLAGVQWQTVILDEAQAIKNMHTKRSKSAMQLRAECKIITTGTPIENHLGELWNLFRFLNPGLLGSYESFKRKFAIPIEKKQDRVTANHLKKLIQPFILRRLKHAVLQELPERTEVTMQVEMSAEEAAMYEAQRLQALESLEGTGEEQSGGAKHLQVLAEITRLRRFCCNPELVVPDMGIPSSKLKVFTTVVTELLENKHKALVFSQFVGHLALIREHLDRLGISYQYLDGSTSAGQRAKRVKAFQAGEGDVFLISLKAGGVGLNLTAADYVIHMDPWWNPAVEDQASDRAHRIGQQRPVTIYRLVVKDSIEEKIVALHKVKRDLADNLLSGSDMSGRISTEELLNLLKSK